MSLQNTIAPQLRTKLASLVLVGSIMAAVALVGPRAEAEVVVTGVVVDADGNPLEGVKADAWTWYSREGNQMETDAEGRFRLTNLEAGEVQIRFTKDGYCPRHFPARTAVDTSAEEETKSEAKPWRIVMRNDTYIEGRVLSPAGEPLAGARVRARRGPFRASYGVIGEVWAEADADDQGRYRLYLEPDSYEVLVRRPGVGVLRTAKTPIEAGEQRSLDLQLAAGATFRAKLLNSVSGEPVPGIRLFNWQQNDIKGVSDAEGELAIDGMSPGKFQFQVAAVGKRRRDVAGEFARWWSPQAVQEHQRRSVQAGQFQRNFDNLEFDISEGMDSVTIYLEPCVTVRGVVTSPSGLPVKGVTVAPAKTGSGNSITGDTRYSRRTNKKGRFTLKLPASGAEPYNLVAHDGAFGEWRGLANGVGDPFKTTPGQVIEGVELQLNDPASVTGRVLDANGKPAAGKRVRAVPTDGLSSRYYIPETKTDAQGKFTLAHLRPGDHLVQAEPFWLQASAAPDGTSAKVSVELGDTAEGIEIATPVAPQPLRIYGGP